MHLYVCKFCNKATGIYNNNKKPHLKYILKCFVEFYVDFIASKDFWYVLFVVEEVILQNEFSFLTNFDFCIFLLVKNFKSNFTAFLAFSSYFLLLKNLNRKK